MAFIMQSTKLVSEFYGNSQNIRPLKLHAIRYCLLGVIIPHSFVYIYYVSLHNYVGGGGGGGGGDPLALLFIALPHI